MVLIGNEETMSQSINEIIVHGELYFYDKEQSVLYSSRCAHQGANVNSLKEGGYVCPVHRWKYDSQGQCINVEQKFLKRYKVIVKDGNLYADLPILEYKDGKKKVFTTYPTIHLHSHATLDIRYDGFSLLFDPWLDGNAFMDAWAQYPPNSIGMKDLAPNAIFISHEHSDHFHEETLKKAFKSTPIFIPDFPNQRMNKKLQQLGFENINPVSFGKRTQINEDIFITTYEPSSLWNDAFILIEIGDLKILNLNDAGINHKVAKEIGGVNIIASSFSPGASGYPMIWRNLTMKKKKDIMKSSCLGMLRMLEQAAEIYQAEYILPFASHFTLWNESHQGYIDNVVMNDLEDVVEYFEDSDVEVIRLLPGGVWNSEDKKVTNTNHLSREDVIKNIRQKSKSVSLNSNKLNRLEVEGYLLNLNNIPEIIFCEDITVQLSYIDRLSTKEKVFFEIKGGKLTILEFVSKPNITMNLPMLKLIPIIRENESWDELTIGYWGEFSRNPNTYHADFWRLLQAPYYEKKSSVEDRIKASDSIASILEFKGELARRVMERYGMYCLGCNSSIAETIEQGAKSHGLDAMQIKRLIQELNF